MRSTLVLAVLTTHLVLSPSPETPPGGALDVAEVRRDRGEVGEEGRARRDDARDLDTLRRIQVALAQARVERDADAVDRVDERVLEMLGREESQSDAHTRIAAQWKELRGEYETEDLQRRVHLLDELVDLAREPRRGDRRQEDGPRRP